MPWGSMKHELWMNEEGLGTFCHAGERGNDARALLEPGSKLVWICEAHSHFDAMTKYYEYMSWGIYTTDYPKQDKKTYTEMGWE